MDSRRNFLIAGSAAVVLAACRGGARTEEPMATKQPEPKAETNEENELVTPGEDLMREHGILERVLLVYEEAERRLAGGADAPLDAIKGGAAIIGEFVEQYHEKLEEEFLFPRFEQARRLADLVAVLRQQHDRGRVITAEVQRLAGGTLRADADRRRMAELLAGFSRMYRPHAAREDTVLFPAFQEIVGVAAYRELGEQFEDREHQLFGEEGFKQFVERVASLETALGIGDLASFTPK